MDRQPKHFERLGVGNPRQTLSDLVEKAADLMKPVVNLMKQELLGGSYVQVDETPVRVLDPEIKGQSAQGYLWVLGRPQGNVVFEFHPGRGREFAEKLIGDFKGVLQRDGYGVYGAIAKDRTEIISAGCLAHGRRKFIDAQADEPVHSLQVLRWIRRLYALEKVARDENFGPEERLILRQSQAPSIWKELKEYLDKVGPKALPQSPFAKAVRRHRFALASGPPGRHTSLSLLTPTFLHALLRLWVPHFLTATRRTFQPDFTPESKLTSLLPFWPTVYTPISIGACEIWLRG